MILQGNIEALTALSEHQLLVALDDEIFKGNFDCKELEYFY